MKPLVWPFILSIASVALLAAIADVFPDSGAGALFLPGALLAALVFPDGVHSSAANTYLVLAFLLEIPVVMLFFVLMNNSIQRRRIAKGKDGE